MATDLDFSALLESKTDLLWAALVSAIVSAGVSYYFKRREIRHTAQTEYEYEQKKKLRELIGRYHGRLLSASDSLNHRFWNLYRNQDEGWLEATGQYEQPGYYFASFVYRFLSVCALVRQIESEAIFLDARIAEKSDFLFLNYVAAIHWVMTGVELFHGIDYRPSHERDHFFSDNLRHYSDSCWRDGQVISFDEFCSACSAKCEFAPALRFFDSLHRSEDRLRWDRLVALHLVLLAFINRFGYARQRSQQDHFNDAARQMRHPQVLENLVAGLPRRDLGTDREARRVVKSFRAVRHSLKT